ncbi:pentatricopeptide repeat-containing protein At3g06920 [Selaginella moellendorffii]|uniref:pentatricopeptide repeat-containing protein At3g06920 n=1 Tax=Selaginella moellendorffii TaxID=88036 RepID=UPI000D1C569E|nr:pentatricopeptide repeat-containing protein At3g06920 [Selaginella moellendorffii]|eukprot:XP_024518904.1 pentatricopeptide repeat-containing protein At3g06920 [Selaginella moellendorffii]
MRVGFQIARAVARAVHGSGNAVSSSRIFRPSSSSIIVRGLADDFSSLFDQNAMKTKAPGKAREDGEATKAGKVNEDKEEVSELDLLDLQFAKIETTTRTTTVSDSKPESLEPIVQEIPLLPPFGSDEELIEYATAVVKETPWRQLYTKLAVLGDQVKAHHVPEIIKRAKDSPVVFSFFMWVRARRHIRLDSSMFTLLFEVLSSTDKPEEMEWLLDQMPKWGIPVEDSMVVTVMLAYGRLDRAGDALKLFLKMEELGVKYPKTSTFNCILRLLLNAGRNLQFDMVHKRMTMMRKMNALTYEILIAKVCRFGAAESAYEVFQEMKDVEHQPSVAAYASLVESLSKAGREDIAIQVLEEMETPSAEVYNPLVRNLVLAGKLGVALTQYKKMLEAKLKPVSSTCIPILTELVITERSEQACSLFREMIKSGYASPADCLPVVESSYKKCKIEMVWSFIKELPKLPDCDFDEKIIYSLVKGLMDKERLDLARKLFQSVLSTGKKLPADTYNLFILKLRTTDGSKQIFDLMKQNGCVPDTRSYNGMIEALVRAGSIGEAYQLFVEMMDKGYQADAITYKLLMQILSRDEKMNASTVTEAMTKLKEKGKFEAAGTYLDKLSQQKLLPFGKGKGIEGKVLVKVLQKDGRRLEDIYM